MTRHCARAVFVLLCVAGISLMGRSIRSGRVVVPVCGMALLVTLVIGARIGERKVTAQDRKGAVQAPMFEVDPLWPKPLPNHWVLGS